MLQVKSNTAAGRAVRKQARDKKSSNLIGSGSNQYPNVCLSVENVFAHLLYTNVLKKIGKNNLFDSNIKLLSFTSVVPHLSVCLITWDENMHQEKKN